MADESAKANEGEAQEEPHGTETPDYEALYKEAVKQSRKWEDRAKANKEKADRWDAYEQEGLSEAEKLAKRAESAEAELASLKARAQHDADAAEIAKKTGVPAQLLGYCADRESMEAFAREYAEDHKLPAAPPAPKSRVVRGDTPATSTRDKFASYFE